MNRADLQKLANARLREARLLFRAGEHSGAYYLAGYSVECGLKACFAKGVQRYDFPDRKDTSRIFTHKLADLVTLANLDTEMIAARKSSPAFSSGWDIVRKWSEDSRYGIWSRDDSEAIVNAIANRKDGVMPWIRRYW